MADEPQTEATEQQADDQVGSAETEERPDDIDAMRQALKRANKEAEKSRLRLKEVEAETANLQEKARLDAMSETERQIEQARKEARDEGRNEALSQANERLFKAEVKAASAGKIIDSDLLSDVLVAQRLLGLDAIPTTSTGDIDGAAIASAVDSMLEAKPHLAVSATQTPGSADQGARPNGSRPAQLSQADLQTMSPQEITAAGEDGRLNDLLGRR
jgi:hypothetical protein